MKNIAYLISALFLFASCGESDSEVSIPELNLIYNNSFESSNLWGCIDPRVQKGNAHSGMYYCVMDSVTIYSTTFNAKVENISKTPLNGVEASVWVKVKNLNSGVSFGIQIATTENDQPKTIFLGETVLKPDAKNIGTWVKLTVSQPLPGSLKPTDEIKIFAFNQRKETVYIDDINIQFNSKDKK